MKINAFFINDKKYLSQKTLLMLIIYIIGIVLGAIYCTLLASQFDDSLYSYLSDFFQRIKEESQYLKTLKNSLFTNIRLFFILFVCSYFRPGSLLIMSTAGIKGFVAGFASGIFIKYYGIKGILLNLLSLPSNLLFLPAFLVLSAASAIMSSDRKNSDKSQKRKYIVLAICCLTIFCVSSVFDSFLTTTFMKILASYFAK